MNPSTPGPIVPNNVGEFHSRDCAILIDDQPGDSTVRSPSPERLYALEAERERLKKLGFNLDGTRIQPPAEAK
jgi:hypothetical protein